MRVVFSPAAERDLAEIWHYSFGQWGLQQADHYIAILRAAAERLGQNPHSGVACNEIREGYRQLPSGPHRLYHRIDDGILYILRVLHQSQDADSEID